SCSPTNPQNQGRIVIEDLLQKQTSTLRRMLDHHNKLASDQGTPLLRSDASDFLETTACCCQSAAHPQCPYCAMQLKRGDAFTVRRNAAIDFDLASGPARLNAQANSRKRHNHAF